MDSEPLPHRGTAWRTAQGCLGIWSPSPNVLIAALRGHAGAELVVPLLDAYERLPAVEPLRLFFDLQGLKTYESTLAAGIASRVAPDRARVSADLLLDTPHLTMGFGIVGITLGKAFEVWTERDRFRRMLELALSELRVVGFSLDALDALTTTSKPSPR